MVARQMTLTPEMRNVREQEKNSSKNPFWMSKTEMVVNGMSLKA